MGVAMDITGTNVTKEAADMALTDDNFASIEAAVEEGRAVFDNLTKFIVWILPINAGLALILLAAIIAGVALPLVPTRLLWINMVTAVLLGLTLVFETKKGDLMQRRPRSTKTSADLSGSVCARGWIAMWDESLNVRNLVPVFTSDLIH